MAKLNLGKVVGSDAEVTSQNIENALGYKPASQEDLESIDVSEDIENHNTDENAHEDIRQNLDETNQQLNEIEDNYIWFGSVETITATQSMPAVYKNEEEHLLGLLKPSDYEVMRANIMLDTIDILEEVM